MLNAMFCYEMLCFAMKCYVFAIPCYILLWYCYTFAMSCYVLLSAATARFSRFASPQNEIVNEMTSEYTFVRLSTNSLILHAHISVKEERLWLQQTRRR